MPCFHANRKRCSFGGVYQPSVRGLNNNNSKMNNNLLKNNNNLNNNNNNLNNNNNIINDNNNKEFEKFDHIENDVNFLAFSSFFFAYNFLNLPTGRKTSDLNTLNTRAKKICSLDWKKLQDYGVDRGEPLEYLPDCCFQIAYVHALLHTGYGLKTENTPIQVVDKIGNNSVTWALGMMLYEANRLNYTIIN